ncbi:N-acetyltransferase family protein [Acidocella sp.]|uniref:GNAT family N-acetyltransferase n=1 Tax=Acidocella sp. TaxID=50710 RepID=UPI003D0409B1
MTITIRPASPADSDAIWDILSPMIRAGETYALPRDWTREQALAYWLAPEKQSFVAQKDGQSLGTYYIRANQAGGGAHVANCGYVTAGWAAGQGIARAMCLHSLEVARASGFRAMQFNLVVSTNQRAVRLWRGMGFETIGRLPGAFRHPEQGEVDALVMYRRL